MGKAIDRRFAQRFEVFDPRAVHSIWMKWYLNAFIPPTLLADILLEQSVAVGLLELRFIIAGNARVDAIKINATRDSSSEDPFRRYGPMVFDHFASLIAMWCSRTEVTARVFWSNAGNTFEAMPRRAETMSGPSERLSEAQRFLATSATRCSTRFAMYRTAPPAAAAAFAACNIFCRIVASARRVRSRKPAHLPIRKEWHLEPWTCPERLAARRPRMTAPYFRSEETEPRPLDLIRSCRLQDLDGGLEPQQASWRRRGLGHA